MLEGRLRLLGTEALSPAFLAVPAPTADTEHVYATYDNNGPAPAVAGSPGPHTGPDLLYAAPPPIGAERFACTSALDAEVILHCIPTDTRIWINPDIGTTQTGIKSRPWLRRTVVPTPSGISSAYTRAAPPSTVHSTPPTLSRASFAGISCRSRTPLREQFHPDTPWNRRRRHRLNPPPGVWEPGP